MSLRDRIRRGVGAVLRMAFYLGIVLSMNITTALVLVAVGSDPSLVYGERLILAQVLLLLGPTGLFAMLGLANFLRIRVLGIPNAELDELLHEAGIPVEERRPKDKAA